MATFFMACFAFGLLFTIVAVATGASHGHLDVGSAHFHMGDAGQHLSLGDGGLHGDLPDGSDFGHSLLAWVNLTALIAFVMWFGGGGWLALTYLGIGAIPSTVVGLGAGTIAYVPLAWFFKKLRENNVALAPPDFEVGGTFAKVTVGAAPGGVGEIVFNLSGTQRVEGARGANGAALEKGAEVVITGYERGLAIVEDARTFMGIAPVVERLPEGHASPPPKQPEAGANAESVSPNQGD